MIRDINKKQIETKTAQGERVVLIEAQVEKNSYETRHIPGAMALPVEKVRVLATQYLPDPGAEIVIYGAGEKSSEVDDVAWQLALLGYNNVYVYRGGKQDWFGEAGLSESVHQPPAYGNREKFSDKVPSSVPMSFGRMPGLGALAIGMGIFGVLMGRRSRRKSDRLEKAHSYNSLRYERRVLQDNRASERDAHTHVLHHEWYDPRPRSEQAEHVPDHIREQSDLEKHAHSFDAASGAE